MMTRCPRCGAWHESDESLLQPLSLTARHILGKLPESMRRGKPIPIRALAEHTGYSPTHVWRALQELIDAGYVVRVPLGKTGQRHAYRGEPSKALAFR